MSFRFTVQEPLGHPDTCHSTHCPIRINKDNFSSPCGGYAMWFEGCQENWSGLWSVVSHTVDKPNWGKGTWYSVSQSVKLCGTFYQLRGFTWHQCLVTSVIGRESNWFEKPGLKRGPYALSSKEAERRASFSPLLTKWTHENIFLCFFYFLKGCFHIDSPL